MTGRALDRLKPSEIGFRNQLPSALAQVKPPVSIRWLVFSLFALGFGLFGGLAAWAIIVPIKSAIVTSGQFEVVGDRLVVQHLEGGIVRQINVRDGDEVSKGEVIAVLDSTRARASVGILQNQLVSALSTSARLQATFTRSKEMELSETLIRLASLNDSYADIVKTQQEIFDADKRMSAGQVEILQDRIHQYKQEMSGIQSRLVTYNHQLSLVQDELASMSDLYEKGLVTKRQYMTLLRDESSLTGDIAVADTQYQAVIQQIAEVEERKLQVWRERLSEVSANRRMVKESIFDIQQRLTAARDIVDRLTIRSPRSGRIVGLAINTLGEVVAPGERVVQIVPNDSEFIIKVRVKTSDINEVAEGSAARVRLSAYNLRTTPMVQGTVTYVSPDRLVEKDGGLSYFEAHIRLNDGELAALPKVAVQPGMPAQVMITTGEQTFANYLLSPVLGGLEVALRENQ